ncbi:MAG: hypothetical protein KJ023_00135 [Burkholderiaceae bacterium]|nr:hypothetical protein [Burkholderiaceae bacterium]
MNETTKPGDLVGRDASGRIRIDRVIPLPWLVGLMLALAGNAATMYYGQQQLAGDMADLKTEVRALATWQGQSLAKDAEVAVELRELRRRVEILEQRR